METKTNRRKFREENIARLFSQLDDSNQVNIYNLVWSLTAKDLLYKLAKEREEQLKDEEEN